MWFARPGEMAANVSAEGGIEVEARGEAGGQGIGGEQVVGVPALRDTNANGNDLSTDEYSEGEGPSGERVTRRHKKHNNHIPR